MAMRKQCFAHGHVLHVFGHRAKYGSTIEEAREFPQQTVTAQSNNATPLWSKALLVRFAAGT
jgi:hypothetical protein